MSLVAISTLFFKLLDSVEKGRSYEKILKKFNRDRKIHGTSENKLDEGDWSTTYNASRDTGRMLKDFVGDKNMKSELEGEKKNRKYEHAFINEKYHTDLQMLYRMGNGRESLFDDDSDSRFGRRSHFFLNSL